MATARAQTEVRRLDFNDLEVLLRYEGKISDVVGNMIYNCKDYVAEVFQSQKDAWELQEENKLIRTFFYSGREAELYEIFAVLKEKEIEPTANVMMAIAYHIMNDELFGRHAAFARGFVDYFKSLYKDKASFKNILEMQTIDGHHIFAFMAQTASCEYLQKLTDEFDIDVNAPNKPVAEDEVHVFSTRQRVSTLARVVESMLLTKLFNVSHECEAGWQNDPCEVIKFLVSRNASLGELLQVFKCHEKRVSEQTSFHWDETPGSVMKKYIDVVKLVIAAIKAGWENRKLQEVKPEDVKLSQSSGLFGAGTQNELTVLLTDLALDKLEDENTMILDVEMAVKHGQTPKHA